MHRNSTAKSQVSEEIFQVLCDIGDLEVMKQFVGEVFSEPEIRDLELRWKLLKMLFQGVSQRAIAAELGISLCKITRGAKIIKNQTSVTNSILRRYSQSIS